MMIVFEKDCTLEELFTAIDEEVPKALDDVTDPEYQPKNNSFKITMEIDKNPLKFTVTIKENE